MNEMSLGRLARRTRRRLARRELLALPAALALIVSAAPALAQATETSSTGTSGYNQKPPTPTTKTEPKKEVEPSKVNPRRRPPRRKPPWNRPRKRPPPPRRPPPKPPRCPSRAGPALGGGRWRAAARRRPLDPPRAAHPLRSLSGAARAEARPARDCASAGRVPARRLPWHLDVAGPQLPGSPTTRTRRSPPQPTCSAVSSTSRRPTPLPPQPHGQRLQLVEERRLHERRAARRSPSLGKRRSVSSSRIRSSRRAKRGAQAEVAPAGAERLVLGVTGHVEARRGSRSGGRRGSRRCTT